MYYMNILDDLCTFLFGKQNDHTHNRFYIYIWYEIYIYIYNLQINLWIINSHVSPTNGGSNSYNNARTSVTYSSVTLHGTGIGHTIHTSTWVMSIHIYLGLWSHGVVHELVQRTYLIYKGLQIEIRCEITRIGDGDLGRESRREKSATQSFCSCRVL